MEEASGWKLIPFEKALAKLDSIKPKPLGYELVRAGEALGRILAEDVVAEKDVPEEDIAFMDGYAVRAEDTKGASQNKTIKLKIVGKIFAGEKSELKVGIGQAAMISHYALIPEGATAVIPVEAVKVKGDIIILEGPVGEGVAILRRGADVEKGDILLHRGRISRPQDLAMLSDIGQIDVKVHRKPKVVIISVGDDIAKKSEGRNIEDVSGMAMLISKILSDLGVKTFSETASDNLEVLMSKLIEAANKADLVVTIGGLSVGIEDFVPKALEAVGNLLVRGIAFLPPWLCTFGVVEGKPVVCLPARYIPMVGTLYGFAIPLLTSLSGIESSSLLLSVKARMVGSRPAPPDKHFFLPVKLEKKNGLLYAKSTFRGPHPLSSLLEANGFIVIPSGKKVQDGDEVTVYLLSKSEVNHILSS